MHRKPLLTVMVLALLPSLGSSGLADDANKIANVDAATIKSAVGTSLLLVDRGAVGHPEHRACFTCHGSDRGEASWFHDQRR